MSAVDELNEHLATLRARHEGMAKALETTIEALNEIYERAEEPHATRAQIALGDVYAILREFGPQA